MFDACMRSNHLTYVLYSGELHDFLEDDLRSWYPELADSIKITLVVNKVDRLILELRLPPADAYYKIKHTIEEINTFIRYVARLEQLIHRLSK